ncbi:7-deoxyloganetin glucosyltransferase-like protein, partial [Tanacetum coccineum]
KELNPGSFTLPCTIGSLNIYAMADLGASVNIIPKSMFEFLKLTHLKKTDILVEMADMTKKALVGIVERKVNKTKGSKNSQNQQRNGEDKTKVKNEAGSA